MARKNLMLLVSVILEAAAVIVFKAGWAMTIGIVFLVLGLITLIASFFVKT
jgi:hypothetical protein